MKITKDAMYPRLDDTWTIYLKMPSRTLLFPLGIIPCIMTLSMTPENLKSITSSTNIPSMGIG